MKLLTIFLTISSCFSQIPTLRVGGGGSGGANCGTPDCTVTGNLSVGGQTAVGPTVLAPNPATVGNIISNGDFSSGLSGWTITGTGMGWAIDGNGHAAHTPGNTDKLSTTVVAPANTLYFFDVVVASQAAGTTTVNLGAGCSSDCTPRLAVGFNHYIGVGYSAETVIEIAPSSSSDVAIASVAVYQGGSILTDSGSYSPLGLGNGALASANITDKRVGGLTAIGPFAMYSLVNGGDSQHVSDSVAVGPGALLMSNGASALDNTAIGAGAMANSTQANSVAVGFHALPVNSSGLGNNLAVGYKALLSVTSGDDNVAVGQSQQALTTGADNVGIGNASLNANVAGCGNTAVGSFSLEEAVEPSYVVSILATNGAGSPVCPDTAPSEFKGTNKQINKSVLIGPTQNTGLNNGSGSPVTNIVAINGVATDSNQSVIGNASTTLFEAYGTPVFPQAVATPASAGATCTTGTVAFDASFAYFCVATDTWKRVAIATW